MSAAHRHGRAVRRLAANSSIRSVRLFDKIRAKRHGYDLDGEYESHVEEVEARLKADKI